MPFALREESVLKNPTTRKINLLLFVLTGVVLISMTLAIMVGSVSITPSIVWRIILSHIPFNPLGITLDWSRSQEIIIWQIRTPRVVLAIIVGAGLAISGAAIQALVRNSIADPYILGYLPVHLLGLHLLFYLVLFHFRYVCAIICCFYRCDNCSTDCVFLSTSWGRISVVRLLLAGIAVSLVLSAMTNFMLMMTKEEGA